jgi:hypothetical protein
MREHRKTKTKTKNILLMKEVYDNFENEKISDVIGYFLISANIDILIDSDSRQERNT